MIQIPTFISVSEDVASSTGPPSLALQWATDLREARGEELHAVSAEAVLAMGRHLEMLFVGHLLTQQAVAHASDEMNAQLRSILAAGAHLTLADGMEVVQFECEIDPPKAVSVRLKTGFTHGPRWKSEGGEDGDDVVILGYHENYDLYLVPQPPLPPTLIAKFGNGPGQYLSANPSLLTPAQMLSQPAPLVEAWRRLQIVRGR